MNADVLSFFDKHPQALPLYQTFAERVFKEVEEVSIRVQKTQITFSNEHNFAFVSFLPARKAAERPEVFITVTFGLSYRVDSPRIDTAVEPYANRWTHHMLISRSEEIDQELMTWIREAAAFASRKRGGRKQG
ncbi:MAG: hypothetical protein HFI31_03480 [Lachnospiraceae bacterium]|nr:hypothetical protein [Lachnospiraceae bacterium]MCI8996470.1 hypothetical protein [Lachnospiraceae bacterium]MCI9133241.1 hypothetical protein [Lachnospiraceae bacterium]